MSIECEFCKTTFSSKSSLNYHKKKVKYCLDIQKQLNKIPQEKEEIYKCEFCNKKFNFKNSYVRHKDTCKEKIIKENISEKDIELNKLKIYYEEQLKKQKNEYEKELEKQKNEYEIKLLEEKFKHEKEIVEYKNEQIKKLENENLEINKYILEQACIKNSVVNKSYNI